MVPVTLTPENNTSGPPGELLAAQIANLDRIIQQANMTGNLDGLLAHHILGKRRLTFTWNVDPMTPQWLNDNRHRLTHTPGLAILGFGLTEYPSAESQTGQQHLKAGLPTLMRKNPFHTDGVTFLNDPAQIVGIALAVNIAQDSVPEARPWLQQVLQDPRLHPATEILRLFQQHARHILGNPDRVRLDPQTIDDPVCLAGLHWLTTSPGSPIEMSPNELRDLRRRLLSSIALGQAEPIPTSWRAALLLEAAAHMVTSSIDSLLLGRSHVSTLLSRFGDAMRRWRYDDNTIGHPIQWPITEEREIQDILWMILRPEFDDLVDEETLRKLGHSFYRADFAIPSLDLLIEVKYARKASDFKDIEKEILEDHSAYLTDNAPYKKLLVFIYDESASIQEHGTTRNALLKLPNVADVIVASRPSHVPIPTQRRRRPSSR
ncbi:PD-(D/E)XK nuclease domain-containing protein [Nocardia sp. NPDC004750]